MKKMVWLFLAPIFSFVLFLFVLQTLIIPWASDLALKKTTEWTQAHGPVVVKAEKIKFHLWRPSVEIENIKIQSQTDLQNVFKEITIESLQAQLDIFQIFTGQLMVSVLIIQKPEGEIILDPLMKNDSPTSDLPLNQIFKYLEQIPVQRIWVDNLNLNLRWDEQNSSVHLKKVSLVSGLDNKKINLKTELTDIDVFFKDKAPFQFSVKTQGTLTPNSLKILSTEVKLGQSIIQVQGLLDSFQKIQTEPQGQINLDLDLNLVEAYEWIKTYAPKVEIPHITGLLKAQGKVLLKSKKDISGELNVKTESVKVDQFDIGSTKLKAKYANNQIEFEEILAHHPAGDFKLTRSELNLERPFEFKSEILVQKLDLQALFKSINLDEIPVWLQISGSGNCSGQLESFKVDCKTELTGSHLAVKNGMKPQSSAIVELDKFGAAGNVSVNLDQVEYKADIFINKNRGTSDGLIDFKQGFKINFKTPSLDFTNIKNLSNLHFEGSSPIDGSTEGDSSGAVLRMKMRPTQFVFEKYQLGTFDTDLSYEKGHLKLDRITGGIETTKYQGDIDIDLSTSKISGHLDLPTVNLKDVAWVFDKIYRLPMSIEGQGQAQAQFQGPLDFWKMSFHLDSQFKNGKIATESFNDLHAQITSKDGFFQTQKVSLLKNNSTLDVHGTIDQKQIVELLIKAKDFKLEESEFITQINSQIYGNINGQAKLSGSIFSPEFELTGTLTENTLADQEVPNSFFSLHTNSQKTHLNSNLFGNRIQSEYISSPLKLRIKTIDWNYAPLLSLLGGSNLQNEYETNITADIDLHANQSSWKELSGNLKIQKFLLKRGTLELSQKSPLEVVWNQGLMSIGHFQMQGSGENSLVLTGQNFSIDKLDVNANGKVETKLLHLFLPFFDDVGGHLDSQAHISGSWDKPQILGHAKLDQMFIKLKGFPHPIEKINSDINFSQNKILIPTITAVLGGGQIEGSGDIQIDGIKNIPLNLRLHGQGLNLNIPEKIKSSGQADLTFSGRWFPFLMSGTYRVQSALFEKEFGDNSSSQSVQSSPYLPKSLKENTFQPISLDLQIILEKNILVKNSQVEGFVSGQLQVKGSPESPILLGKIEADKNSKITFKDKIFDVQSAIVNFTNPNELNPELFVNAQSRINDYDINLIVQGPAKNPNLKLTSIPSLSENDIISLLALGITSTKLEQNVQSGEQAKQTATEVFGSVLNQTIGKDFQNKFGLNLQLTNSYDSTKNISVPKVTLSRQLGRKTTVQVSRQLSNSNTTSDVKIQYQLNQNLSAVGSFEARTPSEDTATKSLDKDQQSIFGLDLEFRREFK